MLKSPRFEELLGVTQLGSTSRTCWVVVGTPQVKRWLGSEEDDRRGHKARSRWHTARSRSGGHGQGGGRSRRDASTTNDLLAWKSGRRSDALAERGSCRRPKRRNPGSPVSDPSGGERKAGRTSHRSQRGGGKDNTRSRGYNPLPRKPHTPPFARLCRRIDKSHIRNCEAPSRSGGDAGGWWSRPPPPPHKRTPSRGRSGDDAGCPPGQTQ